MRITGLRRRSRRKLGAAVRGVGEVGGRRRVWHNGRRDWAGRPSEGPSATQARKPDVVPVRELPYWPAAMALLIEAGQMTASDYVPIYPNLPLASEGASTEDICGVSTKSPSDGQGRGADARRVCDAYKAGHTVPRRDWGPTTCGEPLTIVSKLVAIYPQAALQIS